MTTAQSFKIYEVLGRYFQNPEDAKTVVTEIEQIIEAKLAEKKDVLATKEDLLKMQVDIERRFNQLTIWIVGTGIALAGLTTALLKL